MIVVREAQREDRLSPTPYVVLTRIQADRSVVLEISRSEAIRLLDDLGELVERWLTDDDRPSPPDPDPLRVIRHVPRTLLEAIEDGDIPPGRWYSDVRPNPKYL